MPFATSMMNSYLAASFGYSSAESACGYFAIMILGVLSPIRLGNFCHKCSVMNGMMGCRSRRPPSRAVYNVCLAESCSASGTSGWKINLVFSMNVSQNEVSRNWYRLLAAELNSRASTAELTSAAVVLRRWRIHFSAKEAGLEEVGEAAGTKSSPRRPRRKLVAW
jgi:hypothetical protein